MQLKYHQATYDLLTEKSLDPQRAIENFTVYYDALLRGHITSGQYTDEIGKKFEHELSCALAWTRLDLYQRSIHFSQTNIEQLDALEETYHVILPAAVREWYSLDITPEIMSASNSGVGFIPIGDFKPFSKMIDDLNPDAAREDLWYFLFSEYIDQGGDYIAFKIDSGDDPPVFAEYLGDFIELAPTFSQFLYLYFWDWLGHYTFIHGFRILEHSTLLNLNLPPRYNVPVDQLRERFSILEDNRQMRFYDEHTRIWERPYRFSDGDGVNVDIRTIAGGEVHTDSIEALSRMSLFGFGPMMLPYLIWMCGITAM